MAPTASEATPVSVVESLKTSRGKVNLDVFPDGLKTTGEITASLAHQNQTICR